MTTNHLVSWDVYARNLDDGIYNVIDLYNQPMGCDNQENIETRATTAKHSNTNMIEKNASNCREETNQELIEKKLTDSRDDGDSEKKALAEAPCGRVQVFLKRRDAPGWRQNIHE